MQDDNFDLTVLTTFWTVRGAGYDPFGSGSSIEAFGADNPIFVARDHMQMGTKYG
jgi:hypothetical protein